MTMHYLPCETVETQADVSASVIWLHGLGASGHDFVPVIPHLQLPDNLGIRFVFPHAPSIPVTVNGGLCMPAWYDILALTMEREINEAHLMASAIEVDKLIDREIEQGIPSERIVLAGFSQGGAVVYQAALSAQKPLAGLMCLSTYFATHKTLRVSAANKHLPIHLFHGTRDQVVPEAMGQQALTALKARGFNPEYKTYRMGHELHPLEIRDISQWLQQRLEK